MNKWMDISRELHEGMNVWPGDAPFHKSGTMSMEKGDSVNVSKISMSVHTGTHADAPYHYSREGSGISEIDINRFSGPALVVGTDEWPVLTINAFQKQLPAGVRHVLFKTAAKPGSYESFPVMDPALIHALGEQGVQLIGTNAPSVDPLESKDLPAHHACLEEDILILEGLNLHIEPGLYELVAFPLKLHGADGSPVRAALRKREGSSRYD
ncbi:cyclase family protein [Alkalicoccus luteus]|uniref:cyclase family protein n=1 Tax=Alkalicoccus luteus TaxID=1237094 RepID=UPI0040341CB1